MGDAGFWVGKLGEVWGQEYQYWRQRAEDVRVGQQGLGQQQGIGRGRTGGGGGGGWF